MSDTGNFDPISIFSGTSSSSGGGGGFDWSTLGPGLQSIWGLFSGSQAGNAASDVFNKADPFNSQRAQYQQALQQLVFNRPDNPFMTKLATSMVNTPPNPYMSSLYSFMQDHNMLKGAQGSPQPFPQTNIPAGNYRFQAKSSPPAGASANSPTAPQNTIPQPNIDSMRQLLKQQGVGGVDQMTDDDILKYFQRYTLGTQQPSKSNPEATP